MTSIDPVCLKRLGQGQRLFRSEYRGHTYYFECDRCRELFDGNPADFAGKIPQIIYGDQGRKRIAD
jgi:YHS domain-containing protein